MPVKQAIAVRHVAFEDLGNLEPMLRDAGYEVRYLEAGYDDLRRSDAQACDLLVVLGGPISVNDSADYPFLTDELRIVERRLRDDLPTLGICLGAQMMAKALGAPVFKGKSAEIGWSPIRRASREPHEIDEIVQCSVLHWHGETFDLPRGAELLASTDLYENQAFSYARRSLGLQFHAEATARGLERWLIGHCAEIAHTKGVRLSDLRAGAAAHAPGLEAASRRFWASWLQRVES